MVLSAQQQMRVCMCVIERARERARKGAREGAREGSWLDAEPQLCSGRMSETGVESEGEKVRMDAGGEGEGSFFISES